MTIQQMQRDELAMSVARAMAAANDVAATDEVDPNRSLVTITEEPGDTGAVWRIEYGTRDFVGQRGGDLIVLIDKSSGDV